MKQLQSYIYEALKFDIQKWFQQVYKTMSKLVKNNKTQMIDVDVKKLAKPQTGGFQFEDFVNDKNVKAIIDDDNIGFTVTSQMIQNKKQYFVEKNGETQTELKPECLPYWYQENNNVYFIGLVMFDIKIKHIDEFANLVDIETSLCVQESLPVLKAMLNDFSLHYLNKKGNFRGLTAKPAHPKMKSTLVKLGFTTSKDNKNILVYKL